MTGAELRERRLALALTQRQLGAKLGVGKLYIWRREAGLRPVSKMLAIAIVCLSEHRGR